MISAVAADRSRLMRLGPPVAGSSGGWFVDVVLAVEDGFDGFFVGVAVALLADTGVCGWRGEFDRRWGRRRGWFGGRRFALGQGDAALLKVRGRQGDVRRPSAISICRHTVLDRTALVLYDKYRVQCPGTKGTGQVTEDQGPAEG